MRLWTPSAPMIKSPVQDVPSEKYTVDVVGSRAVTLWEVRRVMGGCGGDNVRAFDLRWE